MGPIWVLSAPGGPHVGPINLAIRGHMLVDYAYHDKMDTEGTFVEKKLNEIVAGQMKILAVYSRTLENITVIVMATKLCSSLWLYKLFDGSYCPTSTLSSRVTMAIYDGIQKVKLRLTNCNHSTVIIMAIDNVSEVVNVAIELFLYQIVPPCIGFGVGYSRQNMRRSSSQASYTYPSTGFKIVVLIKYHTPAMECRCKSMCNWII